MQARLLLGPAGSGKTFRCLAEIRAALAAEPDGPPLLFIAPKQATYQLERQLLADPSLPGYTRLQILSFERLARLVFTWTGQAPPQTLTEEGRIMVLRGLLARKRNQLKLFRASARLTGFAQHLSEALRELQRQQVTPESLAELAERNGVPEGLSSKLQDLAMLLGDYLKWLRERKLEDGEQLLELAVNTLRTPQKSLELGEIWVDGFAEFSPQELEILEMVAARATRLTVALCLDHEPKGNVSWLSHWSILRQTYLQCRKRLTEVPNGTLKTELLPRRADPGRFTTARPLQHLEACWAEAKPFSKDAGSSIRVVSCPNPEAEVTLAAREILRFARAGGRYREITVLARRLENYHTLITNIFKRYEIPFFLDRRELVSHHPLAELTRNAMRTIAYGWDRDDWFAALKTGLVPAVDEDIDQLENEALARGWPGPVWQNRISIPGEPELERKLESLRRKLVPPFSRLALELAQHGGRPNGAQLAGALRELRLALNVEETLRGWSNTTSGPEPVHLTVWEQMSAWLENLELAFSDEPLALREWLPILEAGLAGLTVGVIPPALDQVLVGAVDRSRSPDVRQAIVLGMNDTIFPAPPEPSVLLTESDRAEMERRGVPLANFRQQLGRERFLGYIACTRARERMLLTFSTADAEGNPLNASPFIAHVQRLFPALEIEAEPATIDWRESEHASELAAPLLRNLLNKESDKSLGALENLPAVALLRERLRHFTASPVVEKLPPVLAERLYGPALRTSVSRVEQFAACPFRFFVHSGLRAEERKLFELDIRNQGSFQHDVLAGFHEQLRKENKRWRDITPAEARERVKVVATAMAVSFRDGLLQANEETRFTARVLTESLQDFVETLTGWMQQQYAFDPAAVELPFGDERGDFPPWRVELGQGHELLLHGRIDRVDLWREGEGASALCVVVDYKSSQKQLDALLMANGLQLQLPAYLNVLRHWPNAAAQFKVSRLIPAGVFYVNLRGKYERDSNRDEALASPAEARKLAYQHAGRFDAQQLRKLDTRTDAREGDQFHYKLNKDGSISGTSRDPLEHAEFMALLDGVETNLQEMGRAIYRGEVGVDPYRKGSTLACDQCEYHAICRIDPWTHIYRTLRKPDEPSE